MVEEKKVNRTACLKLIKRKHAKFKKHSFIIRLWDIDKDEIKKTFDSKDYKDNIGKIFRALEEELETRNLYEENIAIEYFVEDNSKYILEPMEV